MGRSSSCNNLCGRLWRWREADKIKGYLEMYIVRIWQVSKAMSEVSSFCHWVSTRHRKFMRKHIELGMFLRYINGDVNQEAQKRDLGVISNESSKWEWNNPRKNRLEKEQGVEKLLDLKTGGGWASKGGYEAAAKEAVVKVCEWNHRCQWMTVNDEELDSSTRCYWEVK